jgi:hypothetical protein
LATLSTAYALRAPAGFFSYRRRSWDSPCGAFSSRKVRTRFRARAPTYRSRPRLLPSRSLGLGRPDGPRFLGFDPSGSPWPRAGVNSPTAGCSLGLRPPRVVQRLALPGISPGLLPRASATRSLATAGAGASEFHSAATWPRLSPANRDESGTTLTGFRTSRFPTVRADRRPGLLLHLAPRRASLPTDRHSFGRLAELYLSAAREVLPVPSVREQIDGRYYAF